MARLKELQDLKVIGLSAPHFFLWVLYGVKVFSLFTPFVYFFGLPVTIFEALTDEWGWHLLFFIFLVAPGPIYHIYLKPLEMFSSRRLVETLIEFGTLVGVIIFFLTDMRDESDSLTGHVYSFFTSQEAVAPGPGFWLFFSALILSSLTKTLDLRY